MDGSTMTLLPQSRMRSFLVIVETNHKERESFVHYCETQDSVTKLLKAIEKADTSELWGDVSYFTCSWGIVSEEAVDAHVALKALGVYDKMFQKQELCIKIRSDSLTLSLILRPIDLANKLVPHTR